MAQTISFRASQGLYDKLDMVANETERKKTYHIVKAIEYYLEEYADLQISLDRLNDHSDKIISIEELERELEL